MIRFVCDSTSDLSKELLNKYNIEIVPMHIVLDLKEYKDGIEISPEDIYKWSDETNQTPKTSAASIEDTIKVFKEILDDGDEIIAFTISKSLSTTFNVFNLAAEYLEAKDRVSVIDSRNLCSAIGYLAMKAYDMTNEGKSRNEIVDEINILKERMNTSFIVSTLAYLSRGGRCSGVTAMAGTLLGIKPIIEVKDGELALGNKIRANGIDKMIDKYFELKKDSLLNASKERLIIVDSGIEKEELDKFVNLVKGLNHFDNILTLKAGGVISSHCGPGTFGMMYLDK